MLNLEAVSIATTTMDSAPHAIHWYAPVVGKELDHFALSRRIKKFKHFVGLVSEPDCHVGRSSGEMHIAHVQTLSVCSAPEAETR